MGVGYYARNRFNGVVEDGETAEFIKESVDLDDASCDVDVTGHPSGYTATYAASSTDGNHDDDSTGCQFGPPLHDGGSDEQIYTCDVELNADDVRFTVFKDWDITLVGGEFVDPSYSITLTCDQNITFSDGPVAGSR